jgi:hypothetical protein
VSIRRKLGIGLLIWVVAFIIFSIVFTLPSITLGDMPLWETMGLNACYAFIISVFVTYITTS